jgi:hypothetical protein
MKYFLLFLVLMFSLGINYAQYLTVSKFEEVTAEYDKFSESCLSDLKNAVEDQNTMFEAVKKHQKWDAQREDRCNAEISRFSNRLNYTTRVLESTLVCLIHGIEYEHCLAGFNMDKAVKDSYDGNF